jgi:hypothetical protein
MNTLRHRLEQLSERGSPRGADAVLDAAACGVATGRTEASPLSRRGAWRNNPSRTGPSKRGSGPE